MDRASRLASSLAIVIAAMLLTAPAQALKVTKATIEGGKLVVEGTTTKKKRKVRLEDQFSTKSSKKKAFKFAVLHHPDDCLVEVKEGTKIVDAVVANCGPEGADGPEGLPGAQGP